MNFHPFPMLTTERLILRQLEHADAPEMFIYRSSEEIMKYICRPRAKTEEDALQLIIRINDLIQKTEVLNWGITLKESNKVIGTIGYVNFKKEHYRAEIGYLLSIDYQRKGIMQEAISAVLEYGFNTLKLHSVEAIVAPENEASIALLEKNHFKREGYFREDFYFEGKFLDSVVYSLLGKSGEA